MYEDGLNEEEIDEEPQGKLHKSKPDEKYMKRRQFRCDDNLLEKFDKEVELDKNVYNRSDCIRVLMRKYINSQIAKRRNKAAKE